MATLVAAPREIEGVRYPDAFAFVAAGGFSKAEATVVVAAYKAYYAKYGPGGDWVPFVTAHTDVKNAERARAIMRRYRKFYGK